MIQKNLKGFNDKNVLDSDISVFFLFISISQSIYDCLTYNFI